MHRMPWVRIAAAAILLAAVCEPAGADCSGCARPSFGSTARISTFSFNPGLGQSFPPVVADFNGDGIPDLAVLQGGGLRILLNSPSGELTPGGFAVLPGNGPLSLAVADMNADGKPDIVASQTDFAGSVMVLLGDGAGGFLATKKVAAGQQVAFLAIADFNGDGRLDAAVVNGSVPAILILPGDGTGGFGAALPVPLDTAFWGGLVAGDFDGDGLPDLAVLRTDSKIAVFLAMGFALTASAALLGAAVIKPAVLLYAFLTWALSFPIWRRDPVLFPFVPFAFALHHGTYFLALLAGMAIGAAGLLRGPRRTPAPTRTRS